MIRKFSEARTHFSAAGPKPVLFLCPSHFVFLVSLLPWSHHSLYYPVSLRTNCFPDLIKAVLGQTEANQKRSVTQIITIWASVNIPAHPIIYLIMWKKTKSRQPKNVSTAMMHLTTGKGTTTGNPAATSSDMEPSFTKLCLTNLLVTGDCHRFPICILRAVEKNKCQEFHLLIYAIWGSFKYHWCLGFKVFKDTQGLTLWIILLVMHTNDMVGLTKH